MKNEHKFFPIPSFVSFFPTIVPKLNHKFRAISMDKLLIRLLIRPLIAVLISLLIPARSYRRKSLDPSGAIAGFAVMTIRIAVGYRYGSLLLVFFTSSKLTKVGKTRSGASMPTSKRLGAGLIQQWDCVDLGSGSLGKIGIAGEMHGLGRRVCWYVACCWGYWSLCL
ncbi:hypothetical protein C1H46_014741 [Malus baccata]|uniref:Uncharacterized protein n=1 Tax=Malus baccata TaxID=106549 RepID=A0A540MLC3_MALBA|nr:hypothetical protein C1H46_014741 [Malus baccata]